MVLTCLGIAALGLSGRQPRTRADATNATDPTPNAPARARASAPERSPDVIVVMIDTVRADYLELRRQPARRVPALADLSAHATRFSRAYAQAPWTAPSVASFVTSRYPMELGIFEHPRPMPTDTRTLARVLKSHGYRTAGVSTNLFISTRYGHHMGFDAWDESLMATAPTITSHAVTDHALAQARKTPTDQPLFLYAHYYDPHYDYFRHPGFEADALPVPDPGDNRISFLQMKAKEQHRGLTEYDMLDAREYYRSELAFTDHHIGRLFDGLRALGRFDGAVVVVTADHGEAFLEHGHIGHTVSVFEELVHVPLIIKAPHQRTGSVCGDPVALVDVMPTVLDLADLPAEPGLRGRNLGRLETPRPVFTVTHRPHPLAAVIEGHRKAVLDPETNHLDLFDLRTDPHEQHPVTGEHPELATRLHDMLEDWLSGQEPEEPLDTVQLSPAEQAVLRALGYAE